MQKGYPLKARLFGPTISDEDLTFIKLRATMYGWTDWLEMILGMKSARKRRWLLAYIRDGLIFIEVEEVATERPYDPLEDDDPWEVDR